MRPDWLLFLVVLQSQTLISVLGQPSIGCFEEGECMRSLYVGDASTPQGELECLEHCAGVEDSNYFTYDSRDSVSMVDPFRGVSSFNVFIAVLFVLGKLSGAEHFTVPRLHLW